MKEAPTKTPTPVVSASFGISGGAQEKVSPSSLMKSEEESLSLARIWGLWRGEISELRMAEEATLAQDCEA